MAGSITTVEVCDPHEITPTMWELFTPTPTSAITPPQFLARTYRAGDWSCYKREKDAYRTTVSVGKLGRTCFVRMVDREPTDMVIQSPGLDHYCLTILQRGNGMLAQPRRASPAGLGADGAAIFHGEPGTVLKTDRHAAKINVWIPAGLLRRQAAAMLDGADLDSLNCNVGIDTSSPAGAGLQRMTEWLWNEIGQAGSPLSQDIAAASAQDMFLRTVVLALTEGRAAALRDSAKAAAPATVRRAEEFMRDRAEEQLTVDDIAIAAGCSSRALQAAFRRFRGITPMTALRRIRLESAHEAIMRSDGSISTTEIAARFRFFNSGRFASQYQHAFGEYPSRIASRRPAR
ncbi:AraC family transcriptional regulator [uncultured Bradyrhizobium sp.]|nr:AraC family transcriptional regulator [uncultured Bradyrhizobium sp.]